MSAFSRLAAALLLAGASVLCGCTGGHATRSVQLGVAGNPDEGRHLIVAYSCGSCHTIPGIYTARGLVGPPLNFFGRRTMIAGELPNSPDNLIRWLKNPRAVEPGTAMPNLGLSQQQAQDIAAYLYTLQ
jgi:cytochrome c